MISGCVWGVTSGDLGLIAEITCSKRDFRAGPPPRRLTFDFLHKLHLVLLRKFHSVP